MQTIYAEATSPVCGSASVVELGCGSWIPPVDTSNGTPEGRLASRVETCVKFHQESDRDWRRPALSIVSDLGSGSIRELADTDLQGYLHHLLRLSRQCRRLRFGNEVNDNFLHDYVARVDLTNTVVLGYFARARCVVPQNSDHCAMCGATKQRPHFRWKRQIAPRVLARL